MTPRRLSRANPQSEIARARLLAGVADNDQTMSRRRSEPPDWHMRRPFLIAFLVTAAGLSLVRWWAGLALIAYLAVRYVIAKITLLP